MDFIELHISQETLNEVSKEAADKILDAYHGEYVTWSTVKDRTIEARPDGINIVIETMVSGRKVVYTYQGLVLIDTSIE